MTEIPEDVMKAAHTASLECVSGMCGTYRHDYGLLSQPERKAIYARMSQLAYHDVTPVIARAIMAERERAAKVAEAHKLLDHPRLNPGSEINAWWSGQEEAARRIAAAIRRGDA